VTGHTWEWLIATIKELTGDDSLDELTDRKMESENAREQAENKRPGGDRRSEDYHSTKPADGRNALGAQGSNNKQRILRRIARSRPDILDRYERGEFKSACAAAKEAGS
jgi:hypothetical protein